MIADLTDSLIAVLFAGLAGYYFGDYVLGFILPGETIDMWTISAACAALFLKDLYYA